ncbi:Uncharacterised protein [Mycobacteroides abscessus subsp. abscessus]|nr:Uncharacterised protein [Mycobacteroides abscessus subsp. abscessus]
MPFVSGSTPASAIRPRASSVRITPSTFTPRTALTRFLVTGWRYATTASVSNAALVSFVLAPSSSTRSTYGAYSVRV